MVLDNAADEYAQALRLGQKEYRELIMAGASPYPAVLDEILPEGGAETVVDVGLVEIPAERIIGVKSAGRITAFTPSFRPLLEAKSEFGAKWISLCSAHLGETGITDPILCYEYLGNFYVQEGNKRVSVLRYFGAPRIPGTVKRVMPPPSEDPRIMAYYEFIDFYKSSRLYDIQFRRPGDYAKLLHAVGKKPGEAWTEAEQRTFRAYFLYFKEAFKELHTENTDILAEEALLLWLEIHAYQDLGCMSTADLKKSVSVLRADILAAAGDGTAAVQTKAQDAEKANIVNRLLTSLEQLYVAFVHQLDPSQSAWVTGHEAGRKHIEEVFGDKILVRSYYGANSQEQAEALIAQAVAEGAEVVFTTSPPLRRATLKAAVKHPKVHFFNCSVAQPYSSVRSYYGRIYEAKFITGAIAGAMAGDDRIGYIASYPTYGVPASINAFALGTQLTNPRAQIELRWSCVEGTPQADFLADGIRVMSNRDAPTQSKMYLDFCNYGTYLMGNRGDLIPLGTPIWLWGKFYEYAIRNILLTGRKWEKGEAAPLNYWLGMDSGVIGINLSDKLPEGLRQLAKILEQGIIRGTVAPFRRKIIAQDGTLKNDGSLDLTPDKLLHMDWLCENIVGEIPPYCDILPAAQSMVSELGIYRDQIKTGKEAATLENSNRFR